MLARVLPGDRFGDQPSPPRRSIGIVHHAHVHTEKGAPPPARPLTNDTLPTPATDVQRTTRSDRDVRQQCAVVVRVVVSGQHSSEVLGPGTCGASRARHPARRPIHTRRRGGLFSDAGAASLPGRRNLWCRAPGRGIRAHGGGEVGRRDQSCARPRGRIFHGSSWCHSPHATSDTGRPTSVNAMQAAIIMLTNLLVAGD